MAKVYNSLTGKGQRKWKPGEVITVPANFSPRDYQLNLFQAMDGIAGRPGTKKRRAFLRWHRRAGKDLSCLAYMFKEAASVRGVYYYFLPTYGQGRKIIWEGMTKPPEKSGDQPQFKFLDMLPMKFRKRIQNQEMIIELINGSIFRVVGTDNIDSVMGTNPVGCVFSEYSLQDPRAWEYIRPILTENKGWAIFNGTPRGQNHMYKLEDSIVHGTEKDKWYVSTLQTLWPNRPNYSGIVTPAQIEGERATGMDDDTIEQEFGVSYSALVKGAFYDKQVEETRTEGRIGSFGYNNYLPVDTFWDLGITDSTACWFRQMDGNRIIWFDYLESSGKDIAWYVQRLSDKGYHYRTHFLPHDGGNKSIQTNYRTVDIFRMMCKEMKVSDDVVVAPRTKIQDGINAVRGRFSRFYFNEDSPDVREGLKMLSLYHRKWDDRRQAFMKDPVHDWTSHCADAIRTEASAEEFDDWYEQQGVEVPKVIASSW